MLTLRVWALRLILKGWRSNNRLGQWDESSMYLYSWEVWCPPFAEAMLAMAALTRSMDHPDQESINDGWIAKDVASWLLRMLPLCNGFLFKCRHMRRQGVPNHWKLRLQNPGLHNPSALIELNTRTTMWRKALLSHVSQGELRKKCPHDPARQSADAPTVLGQTNTSTDTYIYALIVWLHCLGPDASAGVRAERDICTSGTLSDPLLLRCYDSTSAGDEAQMERSQSLDLLSLSRNLVPRAKQGNTIGNVDGPSGSDDRKLPLRSFE